MEATSRPPISGNRRTPDWMALIPFTSWKKRGRKVSAPNMANPTTNPMALAAAKTRLSEERKRDDRLDRPALGQQEEHPEDHTGHGQADDERRAPRDTRYRPGW